MITRLELNRQFAEHMEIERVERRLTQKQMADKLGVSLSAYKRIITGETDRIDLYLIYKLYLLSGKLAFEFTDITDDFLEIKKKVRDLSPSQMAYVNTLIDFERSFAKLHEEDFDEYVTVYVPTGNMEDGMIYDSANVEKIKITSSRARYGSQISCGIRITSNHLHPTYNRGDILLISNRAIRDGDTGIFLNKDNGCVYVRKFYQTSPCKLEPVNGYGEVFYVDSENKDEMDRWIKFGRVITKVR